MDMVFVPCVCLIGIAGNVLSFIVFTVSHLRRLSSSVYLAALAASDTGFLSCVLVSWASNINVMLWHRQGWCQIFVYLTYVSSFLSVTYVLGFTVERYIAVCMPFQRQNMCTTKRAKVVVCALGLFATLAYTFALWTSTVFDVRGTPFCMPMPKYYQLVTILNTVDTVITLVVPSVLIVLFNIRIIYAVVLVHRNRRATAAHHVLVRQASNSRSNTSCGNSNHEDASHPSQIKVTRMLIVVSTTFLVLNFPSHALRLFAFIVSFVNKKYSPTKLFVVSQKLIQYIYYVNYAINVFLYSACGRNFRQAVRQVRQKMHHWATTRCASCSTRRHSLDSNMTQLNMRSLKPMCPKCQHLPVMPRNHICRHVKISV